MKNLKGFIVFGLLVTAVFSAQACKNYLTNDTESPISLMDKSEPTVVRAMLAPGATYEGKNPDVHAFFVLQKGNMQWTMKQIACSKDHEIRSKVSDVMANNLDKALFTVTPTVSLNTLVIKMPRKASY